MDIDLSAIENAVNKAIELDSLDPKAVRLDELEGKISDIEKTYGIDRYFVVSDETGKEYLSPDTHDSNIPDSVSTELMNMVNERDSLRSEIEEDKKNEAILKVDMGNYKVDLIVDMRTMEVKNDTSGMEYRFYDEYGKPTENIFQISEVGEFNPTTKTEFPGVIEVRDVPAPGEGRNVGTYKVYENGLNTRIETSSTDYDKDGKVIFKENHIDTFDDSTGYHKSVNHFQDSEDNWTNIYHSVDGKDVARETHYDYGSKVEYEVKDENGNWKECSKEEYDSRVVSAECGNERDDVDNDSSNDWKD